MVALADRPVDDRQRLLTQQIHFKSVVTPRSFVLRFASLVLSLSVGVFSRVAEVQVPFSTV